LIDIPARVVNRLMTDFIGQRQRRLLPAAVRAPPRLAKLAMLRRVDTEEANALAMNLDCVAFNHGCLSDQICGTAWARSQQKEESRQ
jgi:hypothetical protein